MVRIVLASVLVFVVATGCKKKTPPAAEPDSAPAAVPPSKNPSSGGDGGGGVVPAGGLGVVINPSAALGGGGGGGAAQAVRKAARRAQALNELKNLGEMIELMRTDVGRMPTRDQIMAGIKRDLAGVYKAIEEGSYILTGTMDGGGLWAYEVDADKQPGLALIGGRAVRSTPEEVQRYLNSK